MLLFTFVLNENQKRKSAMRQETSGRNWEANVFAVEIEWDDIIASAVRPSTLADKAATRDRRAQHQYLRLSCEMRRACTRPEKV